MADPIEGEDESSYDEDEEMVFREEREFTDYEDEDEDDSQAPDEAPPLAPPTIPQMPMAQGKFSYVSSELLSKLGIPETSSPTQCTHTHTLSLSLSHSLTHSHCSPNGFLLASTLG